MIPAATKHRASTGTLDPLFTQSNNTLSNGNLSLSSSANDSAHAGSQSTTSHSAGKFYFEVTIDAAHAGAGYQNQVGMGLCDSTCHGTLPTANNYTWGSWDSGYELFNGGVLVSAVGTFTTGDVVGVAIDIGNTITWYKNNTSIFNQSIVALTGALFAFAWANSASGMAKLTANFGATAFAFTPPAGFSAWG